MVGMQASSGEPPLLELHEIWDKLHCSSSCGYDACVVTIGIDLTALSTPDGGGIGTSQLHMRVPTKAESRA